ncbi:MAG: hypothetical protein JXA11_05850 [Phycisphaerae bacterium]|nr:hypothetical protein [Phycisphaerae bacterium]
MEKVKKVPPREHPRDRFIRGGAFMGLVGLSVLIVAAVVWLPSIARVRQLEYQRASQENRLKEAQATIAAMERLIAEAPTDEVLTKRLAWSKLGLLPSNEAWPLHTNVPPPPAPGALSPIHYTDPPPPDAPVDRWAKQVQSPAYRRGLLVLAGSLLIAAMLLFPGRRRRVKTAL